MSSSDENDRKVVSEPLVHEVGSVQTPKTANLTAVYRGIASGLLLSLPIIAFAIWIPFALRHHGGIRMLDGNVIGGRFTQTQAKVIDFITGAIIGPILIAILNYYWFTSAHVTVVNEKTPNRGVPLEALVEASSTTSGAFDLWKFYTFWRSKSRRLFLFSGLVLTSAIAKTAFSNIIAYQAYSVSDIKTSSSLRSLRPANDSAPEILALNYTDAQTNDFGGQAVTALANLKYKGSTGKLDQDKYYIGINATFASMDSMPSEIRELLNVPSNRLSIDCKSQPPLYASATAMGPYTYHWNAFFNETFFQSILPGPIQALTQGHNNQQQFVAYDIPKREVYYAISNSFNLTTEVPDKTPYGDFTVSALNMTSAGYTGTRSILSIGGFRCRLYRENGLSNLTRDAEGSNTNTWTRKSSVFFGPKYPTRIRAADFQGQMNTATGFFGTVADTLFGNAYSCPPGTNIGCVTDYKAIVNGYLYIAGEFERLAYEVDATNPLRDLDPKNTIIVTSSSRREFYQITYVPLILLVGLLSVLASAVITSGMVVYSWRTVSYRTWREVSALRLLIDSVISMKDERVELERVRDVRGTKELYAWGHGYRVRYEAEGGNVKLTHA